MKNVKFICFVFLSMFIFVSCSKSSYNLSDYGLKPNTQENCSPLFASALKKISEENINNKNKIIITLSPGKYNFHPEDSSVKEYYISNHDQTNPKYVGLPFEKMKNIVFDGQGSELIFHGRMLPISIINSENCSFKNFSIDFENPHITQVKVINNDIINGGITYEIAPWVNYEVKDNNLIVKGDGWEHTPSSGIAFEEDTKRIVYRTSDISVGTNDVEEISPRVLRSNGWKNNRLVEGTIIAMRGYYRPNPGIFLSHSINTSFNNIKVHYAEGMGLLAQLSENIELDGFSVCLKGEEDPRYFTTQADATHFSGCKGEIISKNGLYEAMMDDAINVHGTYLKIIDRIDDSTIIAKYMHAQTYGFDWGYKGDLVQFIQSNTMEIVGNQNKISSIKPIDKPTVAGAKEFEISFETPIPYEINSEKTFGIENLEWTPEVYFTDNIIRNNRARGALVSTPKPTVIENNLFDHTSGTAILLCGDCNGWYETGACHDVIIRKNKFVNSLTNMFQFTNAIISIYPEIPDLENQTKYFHSNIIIEDNVFETFDIPILYAKSVDGLIFRNNTIIENNDYPAFHWNKKPILLERVVNVEID